MHVDQNSTIILFADLIKFSALPDCDQLNAIEQLNTALEKQLLESGIRRLLGRLPTGDGVALLIPLDKADSCDRVLDFAVELVEKMRTQKLYLRVGIHEGTVQPVTLGTSGMQNFCSKDINLAQRIMDFADGSRRTGKFLHSIACSADFVNNLCTEKSKHFGRVFKAQAKHGMPVSVQFYYSEQNQKPEPKHERVAGLIASYDWKVEKLLKRGLDFYAFGEEVSGNDEERLHKQLICKNFTRSEFNAPDGWSRNTTLMRSERLDKYPVRLKQPEHTDTSISGPGLDLGDLAYGNYRATFYFSVFSALPEGVILRAEVCHGSNDATNPDTSFRQPDDTPTYKDYAEVDCLNDEEQERDGWITTTFKFAYGGEAFVQFRLTLLNADGKPVCTQRLYSGGHLLTVWFHKVNLRLLPEDQSVESVSE